MKIDENFLPKNWKLIQLPELLFFQEGPGVRKHQFTDNGVKLVNGRNIVDNELILENTKTHISKDEAYGKYDHFLVDEGDLIIASSGIKVDYFHKKIAFVKKKHLPLCMNTSTIRFKSLNSDILDINYFKHFMMTPFFAKQVQFYITGSAQLNFGPSHLKKMNVIVPPIKTQKKIVEILEKAKKLKELRIESDVLIDEYLKSIFLDMFGDIKTNPNGWKFVDFNEIMIGTPQNGLYKNSSFYTKDNSGVPILRIDSFYNGKIVNLTNLKRLNCTSEEINQFKLENNNIVINRVNSIEYLGKCALIENIIEPTVYESNVMKIEVNLDLINPVYITKFLCTDFVYNQIISRAKRAVNQASINQKDVNSLKILLPPIKLQNQFAKLVRELETIKLYQTQSREQIDNLFNTLIHKAFKGELIC